MRRCNDCEHVVVEDCGPYDKVRMCRHDSFMYCKIDGIEVKGHEAKECQVFEDMEGEEE